MLLHKCVKLLLRALLANSFFFGVFRTAGDFKLLIVREATLISTHHVAWLVTLTTAATITHILISSYSNLIYNTNYF